MLPFLSASLPKIVGIGLQGVFEIIRESRQAYPNVCRRALTSLLNILQGLQPEELAQEPASVMEPTFETLLELASSVSPTALEAGAGSGLVTNEIYVLFAVLKKKIKIICMGPTLPHTVASKQNRNKDTVREGVLGVLRRQLKKVKP